MSEKMRSRELGLVLARQMRGVEDLHYGLWDADLTLILSNLGVAQQRYTDMLLDLIGRQTAGMHAPRILDVGCGTGSMLQQLYTRGFRVDAVNPSAALNRLVRERLRELGDRDTTLLETTFEAIPVEWLRNQYDLVLFSESFQYIPLAAVFERLPGLLAADGQVLICDFFKTAAHGQGGPGDLSFGGGHALEEFYRRVEASEFGVELDVDLTSRVSPNIALLDEWLGKRLVPSVEILNNWLLGEYPLRTRLLKLLLRRQLARLDYKYLSGNRSQAVFEKYKSYRLLLLQLPGMPG
ncbi:MAG: class I SAM-dependent methyltransferase [Gammaproteobacteria bacterium]|nr:MAG: class I SAM-dependent methyltransferase [Gammaproteobacteria bacterium]